MSLESRKPGRELSRTLLQTLGALVLLFLLVLCASIYFHGQLSALCRGFITRFGLLGLGVGTFAADAFAFPVPPQFYLLTAVAAGMAQTQALVTISISSVCAGTVAYLLARRLAAFPFLLRRLEPSRERMDLLLARYGPHAVLVGCVTPIPFSMFCYCAGLYRMPRRLVLWYILLRVPRILFYYWVIRAGWVI